MGTGQWAIEKHPTVEPRPLTAVATKRCGARLAVAATVGAMRVMGCAFVVACLVSVVAVEPALADSTVIVNTTNPAASGPGVCSLPEAVTYANGSSEPGCASGSASGTTTIVVPASPAAYTVTSTLDIVRPANIEGRGEGATVISGGGDFGAVEVIDNASALRLTDLTITHGNAGTAPGSDGLNGGAIDNQQNASMTITDSAITANQAGAGETSVRESCPNGCVGSTGGTGGNGGGIYNDGSLIVRGSTISHNRAGSGGFGSDGITATGGGAGQQGGSGENGGSGGGIYNDVNGQLLISDSTISDNVAGAGGYAGGGSAGEGSHEPGGNAGSAAQGGGGGGIYTAVGVGISNSTIAGNKTGAGGNGAAGGAGAGDPSGTSSDSAPGGNGGGLDDVLPTSERSALTNDTVTGNSAAPGGSGGAGPGSAGLGGGIFERGNLQLTFATLADNTASGGSGQLEIPPIFAGEITVADSVIGSDAGAVKECGDGEIVGSNDVDFGDPTHSCPGANLNPKLGPLQNNGGPTQTMALGVGSGAIGLVPLNLCPLKNDQRGITRPQGAHCDAGSYEFAPPTIASLRAAGRSATTGTATAQINPNFSSQDTIVNVKYGTTPAYGSSTTAQEIGRGDTAVSFHATLSGLKPGATYYVEIAATNADGTSTATGGKFTTRSVGTGGTPGSKPGKPGLHAKINHKHHTAKFTFSDSNATGFQCALVKSKRHSKKKPPKPRYSACRSPKTYKHLSRGRYQFFVRGTDTAGAGVAASFKFSF